MRTRTEMRSLNEFYIDLIHSHIPCTFVFYLARANTFRVKKKKTILIYYYYYYLQFSFQFWSSSFHYFMSQMFNTIFYANIKILLYASMCGEREVFVCFSRVFLFACSSFLYAYKSLVFIYRICYFSMYAFGVQICINCALMTFLTKNDNLVQSYE
jgi:hypothetical protein